MSGIAAIFHPSVPKPVDPARLRAMVDALAHRGPDGDGVWTAPGIGLGHRRLALLDRAGGAQPMASADRGLAVACDGNILNFRALRTELAAAGAAFRTDSDAEVVLAAWRRWGPACLDRFEGGFAIALYDAGADALFLARDRVGLKPLHCALLADGALVAASELKGLLAHPLLRRAASPQAIDDCLTYGFVPDEACLVAGVRKLPAGHFLLVRRGRPVPEPTRWWEIAFPGPSRVAPAAQEEELAGLLDAAVAAGMTAAVPAGALLSGGLASASVVAIMAGASRPAIETCTLGGVMRDGDEARAEAVAARFATRHRSRPAAADEFALADTLASQFDEPFGDPAALTACRAAALAAERSKMALTGAGGTLLFAGADRFPRFVRQERVRGLLPAAARRALAALGAPPAPPAGLAEEAFAAARAVTPEPMRSSLYTPSLRRDLQGHRGERRWVETFRAAPAGKASERAFYAELKTMLPGGALTRLDRTAMAAGLEARSPLLDHRLVEFAARLPAARRGAGGAGRSLLASAMRRHLPAAMLGVPRTRPPATLGAWFRGSLAAAADALARSPALLGHGRFDEAALARLAAEHRAGRRDHGRLLWQLLMLEKSLARLFGDNSRPASR